MQNAKHRILLVNFTPHDASLLLREGYNVELGYLGPRTVAKDQVQIPYFFPHPPYEYEIFVYNSALPPADVIKSLGPLRNLAADEPMLSALADLQGSTRVKVAFIENPSGFDILFPAGLPSIKLLQPHTGVSIFQTPTETRTFAIPELEAVVRQIVDDIKLPVGRYLSWGKEDSYPIYHLPVIFTRNGDQVGAYGTYYRDRVILNYIVLPQFTKNASVLLKLLNTISKIRPELFPDRQDLDWYESEEFAFREEKAIDEEIRKKIRETQEFIAANRTEKQGIAKRWGFIKEILVATEGPEVEPDRRLSAQVKRVLEFLGFEVEDIDAKVKGAIRKEDFWTKDGEFLAITEVTATRGKNPKVKEYNDILGRITTIFKRRDLVPQTKKIYGLLIMNYDIENHPLKRPRLYTGDLEEIVDAAQEQEIGLVSTVELYKIAIAVKDGVLTKEEARAQLKKPGRVEFRGPERK